LLWASIGAALTIWARRVGSRVQWTAGAAFLVGAAIKLLLLDFGSLGELANIRAVIAAGGVFLLVGWLAPMPPAAAKKEPPVMPAAAQAHSAVPEREAPDAVGWGSRTELVAGERESGSKLVWTLAIVAFVLISLSQCRSRYLREFAMNSSSVEAVAPPAMVSIVESNSQYPQTIVANATAAVAEAYQSTNPWKNEQIELLVEQGSLRRATMRDLEEWIASGGPAPRKSVMEDPFQARDAGDRFLLQVYIVQAPIAMPEPLYGAHAVTFIVPRGMPPPSGEMGHSEILGMNP